MVSPMTDDHPGIRLIDEKLTEYNLVPLCLGWNSETNSSERTCPEPNAFRWCR